MEIKILVLWEASKSPVSIRFTSYVMVSLKINFTVAI
jgi:hypothetical protein